MSTQTFAKVLLKARPTLPQLQDRLQHPQPEGIELYLDPSDLVVDNTINVLSAFCEANALPESFVWIVEAPIRTLGQQFFNLTVDDEDHRETIRRVVAVGKAIGAVASNIHVVAPILDPRTLSNAERLAALKRAEPLLDFYVDACLAASMLPQVENIPPVGRMRESAYVYSAIGAATSDLLAIHELFPTIRFTLDLSHAGLYLNWAATTVDYLDNDACLAARFVQAQPFPLSLVEYASAIDGLVSSIHVSNAANLLGEGLDYEKGWYDLDEVLGPLQFTVPYFVTETLELNPERAIGMRNVQQRLIQLRNNVRLPDVTM